MELKNDVKTALGYLPTVAVCSTSFVLMYLNNFIDQFYINMNGEIASKAYTLSIPIYWTIIALATSFGTGAAILVKKYWAEDDTFSANQCACNAILYCATLGVVVALALYFCERSFVGYFVKEKEVFDALNYYLAPYFMLFVGIAINSVLCTLMAIDGGSRMSTVCLVTTLVINVTLDPLFVNVLGMGTFGNGLGTAVALTASGFLAIRWFRQGHGRLSIGFGYLKPSTVGVRWSLKNLQLFLIRTVIGNFTELCIRLNLYITYALSYGIPMLCASMAYILSSGSHPALTPVYKELAASGDGDGAMSLFRGSAVCMFAFMMGFTVVVYLFAEPIVDIFTTIPGLTENRDTIVWTLRVLCFTAPFIGMKSVCTPVFAPYSNKVVSTTKDVVWSVIRMVLFLLFLSIGYEEAIWFFLFERMAVGVYYLGATTLYIHKAYGEA
ncbi:MAG: MATE family efflux transporter [archaeon]|nr:MATE family efflux transporter [archaeon]